MIFIETSAHEQSIRIPQKKSLNNIVEQDHRAIKRRTRPMINFKRFRGARFILSGIEAMSMIKKRKMKVNCKTRMPASKAEQFIRQRYE